jgi:hypothetical protein
MKMTLIAALMALSLQSFAQDVQTFLGTDNTGKACSLTVIKTITPVLDEEVRMEKLTGLVANSYSKTALKVSQTVLIDENTNHLTLTPDLHGSFGDENQAEIIAVKIDANQRPVAYAYYNNAGLRIFKPINVRCALR